MLNTVNLFIALVVAAITYGTPLLFGTLGEVLHGEVRQPEPGRGGHDVHGRRHRPWRCVLLRERPWQSPSAFLAVLIGHAVRLHRRRASPPCIFSFLTITLRANQNVTGLALDHLRHRRGSVYWRDHADP